MSSQQEKQVPSSDEEPEVMEAVEFKADAVPPVSPSKAKASTAATPSNTPVVSLYSKQPQQPGATKRSFEGEGAPKDVTQMLSSLNIGEAATKKAPAAGGKKKGDPEDEPEDEDEEDEDEDEEDEDEDEEGDEDEEEEYIATPEQVEAVLPLLRENQTKIEALKVEYQKARRELEIKFQEQREVHYKERADLIRGSGEDGPALPGFWLDAMQRNMLLSQFIEEWDQPALVFLDDITVRELTGEEEFGFELIFTFAKNPYFANEKLSKKLIVSNLYAPDYVMPELDSSIGTEINWHPDQNLTVKVEVKQVKRAARKGGKKGVQEIRQEIPQDSFFNFFKTREEKGEEELEQMNDEDQDRYHQEWETDFAIASQIRSKLIPDAALWYTGEASDSEYGYDEDEEEDDDEDGDDGEFDELDDEDEEDEEDEQPVKGKGGKKGGKGGKPLSSQGAAGKEGDQPECKQQ